MTTLFRLVFIAFVLSLGAACSHDRSQDGVLRFALPDLPRNLDPRLATDAASYRINRLLYDRLTDFDSHYRPVPALARWERLSPKHYRFHLRAARFHDGTPLTSADVAATYRSVLDPETASPHRGALAMIDRIETPDEATVDFILRRPDPLFPGHLTLPILPAVALEKGHDFAHRPLGSGPFRFAGRPDEGRLRLVRLSDGQRVEFVAVKDPTVRVLKLLRGEVDLLQNGLPPELIRYLQNRPHIRLVRTQGNRFSYLGFNLEDPSTGDLRIRQAIAHAIDREAIVRHVFAGAARPAETLLPPDHWAANRELVPYPHDPDLARTLLAAAGHGPDNPLHLTYKTSSDPFRVRLATILQHQLAQVGIEVEIRSYDWGTFYGDVKAGRFQLYSLAWVGIKLPNIFRYVFHSAAVPPAGANRGRYRNPEVDRLIETAETLPDLERQAPLYRRIQAIVHRDLPYVPLWYEDNLTVMRDEVSGYRPTTDGSFDGLIQARKGKPS